MVITLIPKIGKARKKALLSEFIIYSREPNLEVAQTLIELIVYPFRTNSFFDVGHTIEFPPENPIISASPLTTAVFALPFYHLNAKEVSHVYYSDGTTTHIVWFIPTYAVERNFFKEHGPQTFFELTLDKEIDLADWNRPSAV